jgi:hypothetical protein
VSFHCIEPFARAPLCRPILGHIGQRLDPLLDEAPADGAERIATDLRGREQAPVADRQRSVTITLAGHQFAKTCSRAMRQLLCPAREAPAQRIGHALYPRVELVRAVAAIAFRRPPRQSENTSGILVGTLRRRACGQLRADAGFVEHVGQGHQLGVAMRRPGWVWMGFHSACVEVTRVAA